MRDVSVMVARPTKNNDSFKIPNHWHSCTLHNSYYKLPPSIREVGIEGERKIEGEKEREKEMRIIWKSK